MLEEPDLEERREVMSESNTWSHSSLQDYGPSDLKEVEMSNLQSAKILEFLTGVLLIIKVTGKLCTKRSLLGKRTRLLDKA